MMCFVSCCWFVAMAKGRWNGQAFAMTELLGGCGSDELVVQVNL